MRPVLLAVAALALTACPEGIRRPQSTQLAMTGTVFVGGLERAGDPLPQATVALVDAATGARVATNETSDTGGYRLTANAAEGTRLVFLVTADGYAPAARAFTAVPFMELTVSLSLEPLSALECVEGSCAAELEDAWWREPPVEASGRVHAVDLSTRRPVRVDVDEAPSALLALAFVALDAGAGEDGGAPESLGALALRVPVGAWGALEDAVPDSGVLEARLAWFDVDAGAWRALDAGVLTSESGWPLPESALAAVRRVEHSGGVVVQAPFVSHGAVAVLGQPEALGCVEGTLEAAGSPALGALVLSGDREGVASAAGGFCVAAVPGAATVEAKALYAGLSYTLPPLPRPTAPGRCGGGCAQAGTVAFAGDSLATTRLCEVTGRVVDGQGAPLPQAQVVLFDDTVLGTTFNTFCGKLGTRCALAASSGDDGAFTLKAPLASRLLLAAGATVEPDGGEARRDGALVLTDCPTEPVTLKLTHGVQQLEVTATYDGASLSWSPPRAAARLTVTDAQGTPKWDLASPVGFTPPVTLGQLPPGAVELTPLSGAAVSGDQATVELLGTGRDGLQYQGAASVTRP